MKTSEDDGDDDDDGKSYQDLGKLLQEPHYWWVFVPNL